MGIITPTLGKVREEGMDLAFRASHAKEGKKFTSVTILKASGRRAYTVIIHHQNGRTSEISVKP